MWYEWFFDGIGTEIISLIAGIALGGILGYKVGIKRNGVQKQVAEDETKQLQMITVEETNGQGANGGINGNVRQIQKAGKKAEQTQIGKIK